MHLEDAFVVEPVALDATVDSITGLPEITALLDALYNSVNVSYEDQEPRRLTWPIFTWSMGGPKGWNFDEPIDQALCDALHAVAEAIGWKPPESAPKEPGA